jgi:glycosyltransferase involved in cell wall biosynthesis
LINQTLKDIEIICINDCSPDNSLAILNEYAKKDERVKVIDFEKNQGVSAARNAGIKIAKGEYVGIVDSDDYVDLDYYEKLYLKAKEADADMVHANMKKKEPSYIKEYIWPVKRTGKFFFPILHVLAIYRGDFLRRHFLEYPIGIKIAEDIVFLAKTFFFANKVEFANDVFYHYIIREGSASQYFKENVYETYGMPLVFDFINKTILDKDKYSCFFSYFFDYFINSFFIHKSHLAPKLRQASIRDIIEIYKNRKYQIDLKNAFVDSLDSPEKLDIRLKKLSSFFKYPKIEINNLQKRKLYIWGAGCDGTEALSQCDNNNWPIEAFLDSSEELRDFNSYSIKSPQQILNQANRDFFVIISSRVFASEIAHICENAGLKEGLDFWKPK